MRKKGIFILVLLLIGILGYNYLYQDHRDISSEKADYMITSNDLAVQFSSDTQASEQRYLDKTIQITGTVTELNKQDLTLDDKVFCQLTDTLRSSIDLGKNLTIKGRFIGYDDLLDQVKLNECILIGK